MVTEHQKVCDWHNLSELLNTGKYEQVAELLVEAQLASKQIGDPVFVDILTAAHRICLACSQCRDESAWLSRAGEAAAEREYELKHELGDILNLITEEAVFETGPERATLPGSFPVKLHLLKPHRPKSIKDHSLWQRLRKLLGLSPASHLPGSTVRSESASPAIPVIQGINRSVGIAFEDDFATGNSRLIDRHPPSLAVYCLGPFRVYQNDQPVKSCSSRKGQSIFKYMVTHRDSPVSNDILMETFWPDADPEASRRNLHQAIYALRQTLRPDDLDFQHIEFESDGYRFNPLLDIWLDCEEFEQRVQAGQALEQNHSLGQAMAEYSIAEGLYRGDFLADDLYEEWPQAHRQYLWQTYLSVADHLAHYYLAQGEYTATMAVSQRILTLDNCQEGAHQNLMRCYLAYDQRFLAARQYQLCLQALKSELDLPPSDETQNLYARVIKG